MISIKDRFGLGWPIFGGCFVSPAADHNWPNLYQASHPPGGRPLSIWNTKGTTPIGYPWANGFSGIQIVYEEFYSLVKLCKRWNRFGQTEMVWPMSGWDAMSGYDVHTAASRLFNQMSIQLCRRQPICQHFIASAWPEPAYSHTADRETVKIWPNQWSTTDLSDGNILRGQIENHPEAVQCRGALWASVVDAAVMPRPLYHNQAAPTRASIEARVWNKQLLVILSMTPDWIKLEVHVDFPRSWLREQMQIHRSFTGNDLAQLPLNSKALK